MKGCLFYQFVSPPLNYNAPPDPDNPYRWDDLGKCLVTFNITFKIKHRKFLNLTDSANEVR